MNNVIIKNSRDLKENIEVLNELNINNFDGHIKKLIEIIGLEKFKEVCIFDIELINDILMDPRFNDLEIDSQSEDKFGMFLMSLSNKGRLYNLHFDEYSNHTKEKYSYLFVSENCPEELKKACLRKDKDKIYQIIKEKPECIEFIKDINLNHLLGDLSFGDGKNFHSILSEKFGNEFYLVNILPYEKYLTSNCLDNCIEMMSNISDLSDKETIDLIQHVIQRNIEEYNMRFDENMPDEFKKRYSNLFLPQDAPEKLKSGYYRRGLKLDVFKEHPEYEKYFSETDFAIGIGRYRKDLTKELSNEALTYLVKVCGEYALNDEFIKFLKENNLKDVSISQLKDVYFDYFTKTDKSFAKLDVLNKMGVQNEDTIRLNDNFLELKKFRTKTQMNNPQLLGDLFNEEILENFGYETISKLLDFNTDASINLIEISADRTKIELVKDFISYLEECGSMNTKMLHYAINSFKDSQDLYKSILLDKNNNINLQNLNEILENGNEYGVKSIEELNNFTKHRMVALREEFESDNKDISKDALCKILFNKSYKDSMLLINRFSLDKLEVLKDNGIVTEEQTRIIEILNNVKDGTLKINNSEELEKFIDENNINTTLNQVEKQMKSKYCEQYNEVLFDENKLDKDVIERFETTPNGKKVRVLDLNNTNFNFVVHKIFSYSSDTEKFYAQLLHNPENWNSLDCGTSTISTSFISDLNYKVCGAENLEQQVILGFRNIPNQDLLLMGNDDILSTHGDRVINPKSENNADKYFSPKMMPLMTKYQTGKAAGYNEITLDRNSAMPSYLIAYDGVINENTLRYAEHFNIPIVNIDREKYANRNKQFISSVTKGNIDHFEVEDIERLMYYPTAKVSIQKKYMICESTLARLLENKTYSAEKIEFLKQHLAKCVDEISLGLSIDGIEIPKESKQNQTFSEQEIGKGTVNTPTKARDVAMEKVCQDLQMVVDKEKKKEGEEL